MTYELNLDSIANIAVQWDEDQGLHVVLAEVERDALVAEVRRLRRALDSVQPLAPPGSNAAALRDVEEVDQ